MTHQTLTLTGAQLPRDGFRFEERTAFATEAVVDVLEGRRLGVIFRDVIPADVRAAMVERFWASPARRHRPGEPSHYVGAYHWNKPAGTYLAEAAEVAGPVRAVLDVPGSPWVQFHQQVDAYLRGRGGGLRMATMDGRSACPALIRAWDQEGEFALLPHEDAAQCTDPRQAGFEIQRVVEREVCAVNMCIEHERGGRLVLWNIRPDAGSRHRLGLDHTGFGYPVASLAGFDELRLEIHSGDVYVFNGAHVHAVDTTVGNRTNVSFLAGFVDERTVVTWT